MKITRAELFRLAKATRVSLRLTEWFGLTKEDALSGVDSSLKLKRILEQGHFDKFRVVVQVSGNGFKLDGNSWVDLPPLSLMDLTRDSLTIYRPGHTVMTEEEEKVMAEWLEYITTNEEYIKRSELDIMTDMNSTFYEKKKFFESRNMGQLLGFEYVGGRMLDFNKNDTFCMLDNKTKGEAILKYEMRIL